jgi:hypothetical protein
MTSETTKPSKKMLYLVEWKTKCTAPIFSEDITMKVVGVYSSLAFTKSLEDETLAMQKAISSKFYQFYVPSDISDQVIKCERPTYSWNTYNSQHYAEDRL